MTIQIHSTISGTGIVADYRGGKNLVIGFRRIISVALQINACSLIGRTVGYHTSGDETGFVNIDTSALVSRAVVYQVTFRLSVLAVDTATTRFDTSDFFHTWVTESHGAVAHSCIRVVDINASTTAWGVFGFVRIVIFTSLNGEAFQIYFIRKGFFFWQRSKPYHVVGPAVLYVPGFVLVVPFCVFASLKFRTSDDGFLLPSPRL